MRIIVSLFMITSFLWFPAADCFGAELIAPTRTLEDRKQDGQLLVFSEPPGLTVTLDGEAVGNTPVRLNAVAAGYHSLSIEDSETVVTITPGEGRRLSYFKGAFVEVPHEEKMNPATQGSTEQKMPDSSKPGRKPATAEETLEPGYFPLDPGGRLYR